MTLGPDIAAKTRKAAAKRKPFLKPYHTKARPLGLRQGFSYDNISELIAVGEKPGAVSSLPTRNED